MVIFTYHKTVDNFPKRSIYGVVAVLLALRVYNRNYMQNNAANDARILWNYMVLGQPPRSADVLLVLGSSDERVAIRAAELSTHYHYDWVVFSGGVAHTDNALFVKPWIDSEAEHFHAVFVQHGGVGETLLEDRSQNVGENARYCNELLRQKNILRGIRTAQIVTKPYMERRAIATFAKQWPEPQPAFYAASPQLSFNDYCNQFLTVEKVIQVMVGDVQRIIEYPNRGLQVEQVVPEKVMAAWRRLIKAGYTGHLI